MAFDLRPLALGELLDRAFTLYRRHFRLFVGLMAVPALFTLLFSVSSEILQGTVRTNPDALAGTDPDKLVAFFLAGGLVFFLMFVGYLIAYMVTLGATTVAVSELYTGRTATIGSAYSRMRGQVGRLMWLFLLIAVRMFALFAAGMAIIIGMSAGAAVGIGGSGGAMLSGVGMVVGVLALFVLCFVFFLRYAVSVPALVLENIKARDAIRRSVVLTQGSRGRAAVLTVFAAVITYAGLFLLQGPFMIGVVMAGPDTPAALSFSIMGAVAGTIGNAITGPLMIVSLAVYYYDVRIRKEGLDLQLMVANLDNQPLAPAHAV
jgi:hypothetical protein